MTKIVYYACCDDCTMSHYTPTTRSHLLMAFDDQTERIIWAAKHRHRTGHTVLEYQRRFELPDPVEAPYVDA